jgi:holo-[acyl-carrier protein] synthase
MPIKTGIDIVKISRIQSIIEDKTDAFLTRVFSEEEIAYCEKKANRFQHYAARFAAKEAFLKALHTSSPPITYKDITVVKDGDVPKIKICSGKKQMIKDASVSLSIAHEKEYAVAVVVIDEPQKE